MRSKRIRRTPHLKQRIGDTRGQGEAYRNENSADVIRDCSVTWSEIQVTERIAGSEHLSLTPLCRIVCVIHERANPSSLGLVRYLRPGTNLGGRRAMTRPRSDADERNLERTGRIVAAYVIRNVVSIGELPCVIEQTYAALRGASRTLQATQQPVVKERWRPAMPVRKSVAEDFIICLEDGKTFKLLRRRRTSEMRSDARTISTEMEAPGRLLDGRPELCP